MNRNDFVRIIDHVPHARQYLPYATAENFTGHVIYDFQDAYLRYGVVLKLAAAARELAQMGYGILVWDGYRPVYAQAKLYEIVPDPNFVSPPGVGIQNHCRGKAVDVTLYDLATGELIEMPSDYDDFTGKAHRLCPDITPTAAANARILEEAMERHGLKGYIGEWWHYNDTEDYPIEEKFIPRTGNR